MILCTSRQSKRTQIIKNIYLNENKLYCIQNIKYKLQTALHTYIFLVNIFQTNKNKPDRYKTEYLNE